MWLVSFKAGIYSFYEYILKGHPLPYFVWSEGGKRSTEINPALICSFWQLPVYCEWPEDKNKVCWQDHYLERWVPEYAEINEIIFCMTSLISFVWDELKRSDLEIGLAFGLRNAPGWPIHIQSSLPQQPVWICWDGNRLNATHFTAGHAEEDKRDAQFDETRRTRRRSVGCQAPYQRHHLVLRRRTTVRYREMNQPARYYQPGLHASSWSHGKNALVISLLCSLYLGTWWH